MEPQVKPGYLSTEFWSMLAAQLSGLIAVVYAVTGRDDGKAVESIVKETVTAAGGFVLAVVGLWQYIRARREVKVAASEARAVMAIGAAPLRVVDSGDRR